MRLYANPSHLTGDANIKLEQSDRIGVNSLGEVFVDFEGELYFLHKSLKEIEGSLSAGAHSSWMISAKYLGPTDHLGMMPRELVFDVSRVRRGEGLLTPDEFLDMIDHYRRAIS